MNIVDDDGNVRLAFVVDDSQSAIEFYSPAGEFKMVLTVWENPETGRAAPSLAFLRNGKVVYAISETDHNPVIVLGDGSGFCLGVTGLWHGC